MSTRTLTPPPVNSSLGHTDGRRRRSQDSRLRIVRAMLELVEAGDPAPGAEQVAARAGVGLRTVFRHFADMDSLYREMSAVIEAEVRAQIERPFTATELGGRILELIDRRSSIYERIAPYRRAADALRHRSPFLAADHARFVDAARNILRQELPQEFAGDRLTFEALDLVLSFESWSRLRQDQGLSLQRTQEVLQMLVLGVIG